MNTTTGNKTVSLFEFCKSVLCSFAVVLLICGTAIAEFQTPIQDGTYLNADIGSLFSKLEVSTVVDAKGKFKKIGTDKSPPWGEPPMTQKPLTFHPDGSISQGGKKTGKTWKTDNDGGFTITGGENPIEFNPPAPPPE